MPGRHASALRLALAWICLLWTAAAASAQQWRTSMLSSNFYDSRACLSPDGRGALVVSRFQGRTFQWEAQGFRIRPTEHTPTMEGFRNVGAIALDPVRRVVVALVRFQNGSFDSIQEFDGSGWRVVSRSFILLPNSWVEAAYDAQAGAVVFLTSESQMYSWNGQSLTSLPGPTNQSFSSNWKLVYDSNRSRLVAARVTNMSQIFEWDGTTWTTVNTPTVPYAVYGCSMAYDDSLRRVLLLETSRISAPGRLLAYDGVDWTNLGAPPIAREFSHMVYVPGYGMLVMLGNVNTQGVIRENVDVWAYVAGSWARADAPHRPDANSTDFVAAYDTHRNRLVCLGTRSTQSIAIDTWEWDGQHWLLRNPNQTPLVSGPIAYDAARQEVVMYGSDNNRNMMTWMWNGQGWRPATTGTQPPYRVSAAMAYDPVRQRVVMFGGRNVLGTALNETWLWDGSTWTLATPPTSPPAFDRVGMAFDEARSRMVAVCRASGANTTWEWNGTTWSLGSTTAPTTMGLPAMAYDPNRQRVQFLTAAPRAVYEWTGTTWVLRPTTRETWTEASQTQSFAFFDEEANVLSHFFQFEVVQLVDQVPTTTVVQNGCSGAQPVPTFGQLGEARLQHADYELELIATGHALSPALIGLGTTPASIPFAGCTLAMSSVDLAWFAGLDAAGRARIALPIPDDPLFVGVAFRVQALVADASATDGLAVSTAFEMRIGR